MIRPVILLVLWMGAAHAGVAQYEQCVGPDYEARVADKFAERFPTTSCDGDCDPWLMKSVEGLVRTQCRTEALDSCESEKCRLGLQGRWAAEETQVRMRIQELLTTVDLDALPPLKARRLSAPDLWLSDVSCTGDAVTCAAAERAQALGDVERILAEVETLP